MPVAAAELARQHFGAAQLGDSRRTRCLVKVAQHILQHPAGTLPRKLKNGPTGPANTGAAW
ncbi:IS4/Tn5 family transposase DNA-binding protein [Fontivita pretiosa]|uniref:IS4/Tn5 family transposase DNA-binding protein n=1 Tax=Fontivita pretiosa TaxID=2989684 RepID=UPI003D184543